MPELSCGEAAIPGQPLEDKILVQANEAETTTASGLVIPDTAKEKPQEGTVVAVGPGRWDEDGENDSRGRAANELTITAWDPVSKQPYFKFAAVRIKKVA